MALASSGLMTSTEETRLPRRTQAERTRQSRQRLRDAAIAVLIEHGYAGFTLKEVVRRAGVSNGALMHHYTSKTDLVIDATAAIYDELATLLQQTERETAQDDPIGGFVSDCLRVYFDWPFVAAMEIVIAARTDPKLLEQIQPVVQGYHAIAGKFWKARLAELGTPSATADLLLNLTLNIVRGMAVNRMLRGDSPEYKLQLDQWSSIAKSILMASRV